MHQLDLTLSLAEKGFVAALCFAELLPSYPTVTKIPTEFELPKRKIVLLARKNSLTPCVRALMDDIAAEFAEMRARQTLP